MRVRGSRNVYGLEKKRIGMGRVNVCQGDLIEKDMDIDVLDKI